MQVVLLLEGEDMLVAVIVEVEDIWEAIVSELRLFEWQFQMGLLTYACESKVSLDERDFDELL